MESRVPPEEIPSGCLELPTPANVGAYELVERIGRGGMGTVYRAVHTRLKRPAAVKILRADRIGYHGTVARFFREMEAVGRLDHPNLVRAYDAGESDGQFFLAMELVVGVHLRRIVGAQGPLRLPDACETVRQAACGLCNAHEHGLVHRDVKPSNLMVTGDGTVKLLDLGLARLADGPATEGENTVTDQILGSGDYLAPEQGEDPRQADARSDLYSLGCVLYFLLAGRAPFDDTRHNTFGRKLLAHATEKVPDIARLRPGVPLGLARLLKRMLAKKPGDRPKDMAEVVQAMEPWSEGANLALLVGRSMAENKPPAREWPEPDTLARGASNETARERKSDEEAVRRRGRSRRRISTTLLVAGLGAAVVAAATALPRTRVEHPMPERLGAAAMVQRPAPLAGVNGWTLETRGGRSPVTHLALSPDDALLAAGDATGGVRVWRTATGDLVRLLIEPEPVRALTWLPDGRQLAVAAGTLRLWDVETGQHVWQAPLAESEAATALDHSADDTLASGHRNGEVRLWNLSEQRLLSVLPAHATTVTAVRFSADGSRLATGEKGRAICLWAMPTGRLLKRLPDAEPGPIRRLAWSPDATRLASCGGGRHVTIWDEAEAFRPRREDAASQPVGDLGWSHDGKRFFSVSGGEQGMEFAVLWDGDVRRPIHRPLMAPNAATAMAWSRDAKTIYCGLRTGELRVYLPDSAHQRSFRQAAVTRTTASAWAPGGRRAAMGDCAGYARLWDTNDARQTLTLRASTHPVSVVAWHPGGERFAVGHIDGTLVIVDASSGEVQQQLAGDGHVFDVAFSPDGRWFATAEEHGLCRLWDAATGAEVARFPVEGDRVVNALAWSPDGRYLTFAAWDARVRTIDVDRRLLVADWASGQGFVWRMVWEPEGHVLLTSGAHGGIGHWDAAKGSLLRREQGCLREVGRRDNSLGDLQGTGASSGMRGISPDATRSIQRVEGSTWGIVAPETGKLEVILLPMRGGYWMAIDPATGHYQADLSAVETPVYVVATDLGQANYTPAEFGALYPWKNQPEKVPRHGTK